MVLWIFQREWERCKNLKVFFCGTVQLFAHFILCYRGMILTNVDYFVCLGLVKVLLLLLKVRWKAILGYPWRFQAVPESYTVSVLVGVPAVTALLQPIQLQHISLHSSLLYLLSFALCLFFSLRIFFCKFKLTGRKSQVRAHSANLNL